MRVNIVIPSYNGGEIWQSSAYALSEVISDNEKVFVIDSSSKDDTVITAKRYGFLVDIISTADFNHGGTRNMGVNKDHCDIVVFITQDAIVQKDCLKKIIEPFSDPQVVCAYGRQLPHLNANPLAVHARDFNYRHTSYIASQETAKTLGLKTVFMSNSFSAYRVSAFNELGGFPENTILCEDMFFAAKAVLANYKVAYVADAMVRHSHNYSASDEFKRYFDIGVFHADESWIRTSFGSAGGEGKSFIISELKYLMKNAPLWIPRACINNFAKIIGYKLGQNYKKFPQKWRKAFSMHKRYWNSISD
ncbi:MULTISPECIES: glycosyltransferase family 2 protein [unclassified Serratia (in: enterobacteria)]|uniref:glycosyltransferase family 2 protein n=1 Tax=unclassified Serratia (in: enterobacteria) TaxID=2647522 RepID=UPI00307672D1